MKIHITEMDIIYNWRQISYTKGGADIKEGSLFDQRTLLNRFSNFNHSTHLTKTILDIECVMLTVIRRVFLRDSVLGAYII